MTRIIPILLAGCLTLGAGGARAQETLTLRVVTFNLRGVPLLTPHRAKRLAAAGPALAGLNPDVVALQEAWLPGDRVKILRALKDAGLAHRRFFRSGAYGSGMLLVSRYPIEKAIFFPFGVTGKPYRFRELDFYGGKGFVVCRLRTPAGALHVGDIHLQSGHGSDEYDRVKFAQLVQLTAGLPPASVPFILAGDLNFRAGGGPLRTLLARAGLRLAGGADDSRIDHIMLRDGGGLRMDARTFLRVLDEPVDLGGGVRGRLSDHAAYAVDIVLSPGAARDHAQEAPAPAFGAADLSAAAAAHQRALTLCLASALALLLLGTVLEAVSKGGFWRALAMLLFLGFFVSLLFGMYYHGPQAEGFSRAAAILKSWDGR